MIGLTIYDINTKRHYHTFRDLDLILNSKEIGEPKPKIYEAEVDGANGKIDLTEFFGEVKFRNRTIKINLTCILPKAEFPKQFSKLQNIFHGKMVHVTFDDDPDWYYVGRLTVPSWKAEKSIATLTMELDAYPYKYKAVETSVSYAINGDVNLFIRNGRMSVQPTVSVSGLSGVLTIADFKPITENGTYELRGLVLKEGDNVIGVSGVANLTFTYREGSL